MEVRILDCHRIEFVPHKSEERINKALKVFPKSLLMRILAFSLHLLGAPRKAVADFVQMPEESVKTVIRLVQRDGFPALRDRRQAERLSVVQASPSPSNSVDVAVQREGEELCIQFGSKEHVLKMPHTSKVQVRTVLLSLLNAGLLSTKECAAAMEVTEAHCRELARKLESQDVAEVLVDKRQGLRQDYRVSLETKAEIIQQVAARAILGRSTTSDVLADAVNEKAQAKVSPRTIRWHINKLGLSNIKETLPKLYETLKKNS